jgi:UDP-N-acetylmuramate dehydrogenase
LSSPDSKGATEWLKAHASGFAGQLSFDEPLSRHTYYRIGGPALALAVPRSLEDLRWIAEAIRRTKLPFWILGLGSNILVPDEGLPGLVIKLGRVDLGIARVAPDRIRTGASVAISTLLRRAAQEGWGGLEFLTGVPGSVGGAVAMNAGTHLGETQSHALSVDAFDLLAPDGAEPLRRYLSDELKFEYRKNKFLSPASVVVSVDWSITPAEPVAVKSLIDETLARRKATQPIDYPSCGSVFKNPKSSGLSAWQVLDRLGLRGHRIGGAQIAQKHSNFIINLGGAKAADVAALIDLAKSRAKSELGIELEEEVKRW